MIGMKAGKVKIRAFESDDAKAASDVIKKALYCTNAQYYPKRVIRHVYGMYTARGLKQKADEKTIIVATIGKEVVGTCQLTHDGWICGLFVHPGVHGMGIGTKLVGRMKEIAKSRGAEAIRTHAAINAVGFYKRLGFRTVKKVVVSECTGENYRMIMHL